MSKKVNLYQFLKSSGLFHNKKEILKIVSSGLIKIDNKVTTSLQFQFNPNKRIVCYGDKKINSTSKKYFVINKPGDYSCQRGDNYPDVVRLINIDKKEQNSLFSVGRLDIPTKGLLLITNDGFFSKNILEPKKNIPKTYHALLKNSFSKKDAQKLREGVVIEAGGKHHFTSPAIVKILKENLVEISITEAKNRQVRKMFAAVGNKVVDLMRVSIGDLKLKDLKISEKQWVELSEKDIKKKVFG